MASQFSQYKLELIGTGEQAGTWGVTTNSNLGSSTPGTYQGIEQAIGGKATITFSSTTVDLTLTDTSAAQNARALYLDLGGTPGGAATLTVPALQKSYIVKNGTGEEVTIKVTGQTGVVIPNGKTCLVYTNGTDVVTAVDYVPSLTTSLKGYSVTGEIIGNTGATRTLDLNTANFFAATLDQACVFTFSNSPASGSFGSFVLELTNGGNYGITWPTSVDWPGGLAPVLTTSGVDQLVFTTRDAGTTFFGFVAGLDIKSP